MRSLLFARGVGSSPLWAGRAVHRLRARRVLHRTGTLRHYRYAILDPSRWTWPPGRLEAARAEWATLTPAGAWNGEPELAADLFALLTALEIPHTAHPADPTVSRWFLATRQLAERYGVDVVRGVLVEAAADPVVVVPRTPAGLAAELHALHERARRRRVRTRSRVEDPPPGV